MRRVWLLIVLILFAAAAASAQFRGGHHRGGGFTRMGFSGGYGGFATAVYPSAFDFFYPSHFPPYPYPAPVARDTTPTGVYIAEATYDWRSWPPPRKIIRGPLTREEADRMAAANLPPQPPVEPLGDVARRLRVQAAHGQRAILRAWN